MRHHLWALLLVGSLAACNSGSDSSAPASTTGPSAPPAPTQVYTPTSTGAATDVELQLSWQPNPDAIAGYRVYFGTTAENATTELSNLAIGSRALDARAPSVTYNAGRDLGLDPGERACFRLRAYDGEGTLSSWSQTTCTTI